MPFARPMMTFFPDKALFKIVLVYVTLCAASNLIEAVYTSERSKIAVKLKRYTGEY
jgi:hypothetical protein